MDDLLSASRSYVSPCIYAIQGTSAFYYFSEGAFFMDATSSIPSIMIGYIYLFLVFKSLGSPMVHLSHQALDFLARCFPLRLGARHVVATAAKIRSQIVVKAPGRCDNQDRTLRDAR